MKILKIFLTSAELLAKLLMVLGLGSEFSYARRAHFMGTITYNDSGSDAIDGQGSGWCYGGGAAYSGCYKLYTCNLLVSNLSAVSQDVTGYSVTITNFTTTQSGAVGNGVSPDLHDPFRLSDGQNGTWLGWTSRVSWASGAVGPNHILRQYTHTAASSHLTPASGWTSTSNLTLTAGQSAVITFGNYGWTMGGILSPTIYGQQPGGANYPFKEFMTCFGYIDVVDTKASTPGFVIASGVMDSKAGSYLNQPISYGSRVNAVDAPYTGTGMFHNSGPLSYIDAARNTVGLGTDVKQGGNGITDWGATNLSVFDSWSDPNAKLGLRNAVDDQYAWTGSPSCSISSVANAGSQDGTVSADWPEVTFNTPIVINGGTPF